MRRAALAIAAGLVAFGLSPALAQERPNPHSGGSGGHAVDRPSGGSSSAPAPSSPSSSAPSGGSSVGSGPSSSGSDHAGRRGGSASPRGGTSARGGATRAVPRSVIIPASPNSEAPGEHRGPSSNASYSRPRGGRPVTGQATPRDISNIPDLGWRRDPYWGYGYWQYSRWMPFYYGPWGGYFYYDPFWWDYYYGYGYYPGYYPGYYGGYTRYESVGDYDTGSLKLKVKPRSAQVYVDGYFSGVVDDYDGVWQRLRLRSGAHRIELRAEGYQPSIFDVLLVAGETVTYRGELKPVQ